MSVPVLNSVCLAHYCMPWNIPRVTAICKMMQENRYDHIPQNDALGAFKNCWAPHPKHLYRADDTNPAHAHLVSFDGWTQVAA